MGTLRLQWCTYLWVDDVAVLPPSVPGYGENDTVWWGIRQTFRQNTMGRLRVGDELFHKTNKPRYNLGLPVVSTQSPPPHTAHQ